MRVGVGREQDSFALCAEVWVGRAARHAAMLTVYIAAPSSYNFQSRGRLDMRFRAEVLISMSRLEMGISRDRS